MLTTQSVQGCLLGLALGDALCAPYEGGTVERLVWKFLGKAKSGKHRWTDDTQMSLDLANSLIEMGVPRSRSSFTNFFHELSME